MFHRVHGAGAVPSRLPGYKLQTALWHELQITDDKLQTALQYKLQIIDDRRAQQLHQAVRLTAACLHYIVLHAEDPMEDRELARTALVTPLFSRHHVAFDAVRHRPVPMLPLGVVAIPVLGVEGVVVGLLRLGLRVYRATLLATLLARCAGDPQQEHTQQDAIGGTQRKAPRLGV